MSESLPSNPGAEMAFDKYCSVHSSAHLPGVRTAFMAGYVAASLCKRCGGLRLVVGTGQVGVPCPECSAVETAALPSDQQLPDKADLLGMAACVQRIARDNQWSNTAEVLYKAARVLEQLAESSPVETGADPRCAGQFKDFYGYVRCGLEPGHSGKHGPAENGTGDKNG